DDELDIPLQHPQDREQVLGVAERATEVVLGVQDQERGRDARGVFRRRDLKIRVRPLEPVLADDALEGPADVARATLEHKVIDRALGARGLESIGMAERPPGTEPSRTAAEKPEPL